MRVLVLGANGQLGSDLMRTSVSKFEVIPHNRVDWDITNNDMSYVESISPDIIINTTAFHNTEECEERPNDAFEVNSDSVKNLAQYCKSKKIVLMHVSTDWVFDGKEKSPYLESSIVGAINTYGESKLCGEEAIRACHDSHYIVRISSVFGKSGVGGKGSNFVYTMMKKGVAGDEIRVVDDIVMSPTYTLDAAKTMWSILSDKRDFGVYHANNSGECSWFEFASSIIKKIRADTSVVPVNHMSFPTVAKRPMFSAMASEKNTCGRPWEEALSDFLESLD